MTTVSLANAPAGWRDLSFRQIKATVESEVLDLSLNISDLTYFSYQAFLEPHRPIFVDSLIKDIIKLDMQIVAAIILTSLSNPETRRSLLEWSKHQLSHRFLDVLQEAALLDSLPMFVHQFYWQLMKYQQGPGFIESLFSFLV
ncbi:hypothetical protein C8J56DRAFT_1050611 [Mycena floridula]|nr:hypothetical protein C8J56DRAFT_1050611 [Mycena floridula]